MLAVDSCKVVLTSAVVQSLHDCGTRYLRLFLLEQAVGRLGEKYYIENKEIIPDIRATKGPHKGIWCLLNSTQGRGNIADLQLMHGSWTESIEFTQIVVKCKKSRFTWFYSGVSPTPPRT